MSNEKWKMRSLLFPIYPFTLLPFTPLPNPCLSVFICGLFCGLFVPVFGRIEVEYFPALARARIDRAQMLRPAHLPDGCDHTILLYGMIGDVFRAGWRSFSRILLLGGCHRL